MVVVFVLGLIVSSLLERRAEVVSIYNNRKHLFSDSIVSQNEKFAEDFPREYQTWAKTADTTYKGEFNSSQRVDVLAARPEMVVLWAGYSFAMEYNTPRGHKHAIEDMRGSFVQAPLVSMARRIYSPGPAGPVRAPMSPV